MPLCGLGSVDAAAAVPDLHSAVLSSLLHPAGTVPTPPSKFLDLDAMHPHPHMMMMGAGTPGTSSPGGSVGPVPGLGALQALPRPSTTPLGSARGLMGEVSLASLAAGVGHRYTH